MSVGYVAVQWSKHKRIYDLCVVGGVLAYVGAFAAWSLATHRGTHAVSPEILAIRATGSCAFAMLHVILCIGPLARLDRRFAPILYNRRHLGVVTFLVALTHALIVTGFYHGFGVLNPLTSLLTSNTNFGSIREFPFEVLGLGGLAIMFVLAATSHDFWLKNLSARTWKSLHMMVYVAYALLVGHVALGALQGSTDWLGPGLVGVGFMVVVSLHWRAGGKETRFDEMAAPQTEPGWIDAGTASDIPMDRARIVCSKGGERIAVFRHKDGVSAITNVCAHQGGPLGEGKVIDGCVTCPWHGWTYRPADGCAPPPFVEKITTHPVRITRGRVEVRVQGNAPGTPVEPAKVEAATSGDAAPAEVSP
ncbi:MAG: Rieske 2Fe-2S domain-containing protein [Phycisphaerales bacterium]|jgi:nitrite reductase/ring-hydroxylating ferredoxin subunit/DMSO/TMAO reductase YedYZ heme-binding membrane subunit